MSKTLKKLSDLIYGNDRWIKRHGSFREKQSYGLISRPNYCYGMLRAADQANYFGHKEVTVLEFGVASGAGLLNMVELAEVIGSDTGIKFNIVGFDSGEGLPKVQGFRDHAELWVDGDFKMEDKEELLKRLENNAQIIFGDINETVEDFVSSLSTQSPIGFVSIDVDVYTGTVSALRSLLGESKLYLPAVSMYFDDTAFYYANEWAGELLAIKEFNNRNKLRKIDFDRSLSGTRPKTTEAWYKSMYVFHVLDHEVRNAGYQRGKLSIDKHHDFMRSHSLY